jgi:hypothetical protein
MVTSPSDAIELLGGYKAVATNIHRPATTVASWMTRQSIPVSVWPALVDLAQKKSAKGLTYDALVRAHIAKKRKTKRGLASQRSLAAA